ncbi:hypothetical protein [Nocardia sp. NBC_01388]|uniref:hypothetical protein n=1 Tax=Nocardia sp. NBC_01388 TaxID=2903596 RepID=UPI003252DDEF
MSVDFARVLRQGYQPSGGGSDASVLAWRTQLQLMAVSREEVITQALAVGLSPVDVEDARMLGNQGFRAPIDGVEPGDRVREAMVDGVVNDTWQLQHMAAIHRVREQHLLSDADPFQDPQVSAQYERNMAALWMRASAVSRAIALTAEEYEGMWPTDVAGWQRILRVVGIYDDQGLEERWRTYAWPGIAEGVHRDLTALRIDPSQAFVNEPIPSPHTMLDEVAHAQSAPWSAPEALTIDRAVQAALSHESGLDWSSSLAPDSGTAPPVIDTSLGTEL